MMTGFFMLSGFSLYHIYSGQDLMQLGSMKRFMVKRFIGIIPAYYAAGLVYTVALGTESWLQGIIIFPVEMLGLQSVFSSLFSVSHNGGTWFISCIILCYICFPLFATVLKQMNEKSKTVLLLVYGFVLLEAPFVVWALELNSIYSNPFFRIVEFLIGAVLASLIEIMKNDRYIAGYLFTAPAVICEIILGMAAISLGVRCGISTGNYMLYSWIVLPLFVLMLPALASLEFRKVRQSVLLMKIVAYLSEISYAFFLMQLFIWPIMKNLCGILSIEENAVKIVLSLSICLILAAVTHEIIEKPAKKYLNRKMLRI